MTKTSLILCTGAALLMMAGCASRTSSAPDEFRVVTKAPLTVPPEYNLRPPPPGQTRPAEVAGAEDERVISFGQDLGKNASASEKALVRAAGAVAVSPVIRAQLDYEEAGIIRKNKSFADRVVFWRGTDEEIAEAAGDSATGGAEVTIDRGNGNRIKLPGT